MQQSQHTLFDQIWLQKVPFFMVFFIVFTVSYGVLYALDWLPEPVATVEVSTTPATSTTSTTVLAATNTPSTTAPYAVVPPTTPATTTITEATGTALPLSMTIPSLGRTVVVKNPTGRDIPTLDNALLSGVVRHPDSAKLGEDGNVLILGHSSYLPNVLNRNFQAFNGIQKLEWGDTITVSSATTVYTYRVEKVYQSKASDVTIPTDVAGRRLTLVTCNSFGAKEDRFIIEATLIAEKAL